MSDVVLVVGAALSLVLTLNAVLSFSGHFRRELSLLRMEAAALAWIGTIVAWELARTATAALQEALG